MIQSCFHKKTVLKETFSKVVFKIFAVDDWKILISKAFRDHSFSMYAKLCAYQEVRNVSFSKYFACILIVWSLSLLSATLLYFANIFKAFDLNFQDDFGAYGILLISYLNFFVILLKYTANFNSDQDAKYTMIYYILHIYCLFWFNFFSTVIVSVQIG